jgi:hypothetical protein
MFCTAFFSFFCVTKWHSFAKKKKFCIMVSVFFRPKFERNCEILCFSIVNLTTLLSFFGDNNYCQIFFNHHKIEEKKTLRFMAQQMIFVSKKTKKKK